MKESISPEGSELSMIPLPSKRMSAMTVLLAPAESSHPLVIHPTLQALIRQMN